MAFARTVLHTKVLISPSTGVGDKVYGEDYVSVTSHSEAVSGADVGGIPYCPTATTETTSANLTYTETSGPRLQVGSGTGTSVGIISGYYGVSGLGAIWNSINTPTTTNYAILIGAATTIINAPGSTGSVSIRENNNIRGTFGGIAGTGLSLTTSTATTGVNALSATQTVNAAGVTFTSFKYSVTYTASAAGSLHSGWYGGAGGITPLATLSKNGLFDAVSYAVAGTAGADFGPGLPTSITVVKGIITAIS